MSAKTVVQDIAVTAELTQTTLTGPAMAVMARDLLQAYPVDSILSALDRCRREISGKLTLKAVIERLDDADGRPGANEAWSIALSGFDETETIVTNNEIATAMGIAKPIMDSGDDVGARMAFRDAYERIVREERAKGTCVNWWPSLGTDTHRRIDAVKEAVDRGRLTSERARAYLPAPATPEELAKGNAIAGLLTGQPAQIPSDPEFRQQINKLLSQLKSANTA